MRAMTAQMNAAEVSRWLSPSFARNNGNHIFSTVRRPDQRRSQSTAATDSKRRQSLSLEA
jgi:hypothetical protein